MGFPAQVQIQGALPQMAGDFPQRLGWRGLQLGAAEPPHPGAPEGPTPGLPPPRRVGG